MALDNFRYAWRVIEQRPSFALIAIVTLAVGIGANTAIFTLLDRVVLRAVPFPEPDRLVVVWETHPSLPVPVMVASAPTLHDWSMRNRSFQSIGGFQWRSLTLSGAGEPERVRGAVVTAPLLGVLAVQPQLGRLFRDDEDRPNAPPVVLISDGLWRRRFGASHDVLGRRVSLDGVPREVIGVMPPGYHAPPPVVFRGQPPAERAEVWMPLAVGLAAGQRGAHNLTVIARLKRGATIQSADNDVRRIAAEVASEDPSHRDWSARVVPLAGWVTESSRQSMALLSAAVGLLLLLGCANVANLLLARTVARRREFAIRTALGAGRAALAGQVLAESVVLAVIGGVAGVGLAAGLIRLIATRGPATIPGVREATLDTPALIFAAAVSMTAAILAGVLPAIRAMRTGLTEALSDRAAGPGRRALRIQKTLVAGQIALALTLLVNASLLLESFRQLRGVELGFRTDRVVTGKIVLPPSRYPDAAARTAFADRLLSAVRDVSGVLAVGVSDAVPMADNRQGTSFTRADALPAQADVARVANVAYVTDGYFEAIGTRLIDGRTFTEHDTLGGSGVVVINRRLARHWFGDDNPIGRLARVGVATDSPFEIIGVVGDDHHAAVDTDPTPTFFLPYRHTPSPREVALIVRSDSEPAQTVDAVRAVIRSLDSDMPFYRVHTMQQIVDASVATPRSLAWLLSGFALVGLLLGAIGVFGVLSHAVTQRTREIGVKIAVGASPTHVFRMVVGEGLLQLGLGIATGVALTVATSHLLSGLLYGVTTSNATSYVAVGGLLAVVTVAACLAPARRAMSVNPVTALRAE